MKKIEYIKDIKHLGKFCKKGEKREVHESITELSVFSSFAKIIKTRKSFD